jgi:hypothetical protein
MKNSTLQSLMALNAKLITDTEGRIDSYLVSARAELQLGEKAFAIEDYKEANVYRKVLAKLVKNQKELKAAMAENNTVSRIRAKGVRMFGAELEAEMSAPLVTSVEVEAALDEALALKFPPKADTRQADHPSFGLKAA